MTDRWETTDLAGHAVDVFTPVERRLEIALLVLPDQGARASASAGLADALRRAAVPAVAPHGDGCWWLDRVEPDFDPVLPPLRLLTEHVLPLLEERFAVRPPGVKLLGWGTGGQGVFQLAYRRPRDFPAVAAIDPAVDFHELHGRGTSIDRLFPNREAARQQTAILRLHPAAWPRRMMILADSQGFWFEGAERLDMKLRSMGIPVESEFTRAAAGPRFFEENARRAVEFLTTERATLPVIRPEG
jgi:S-formylglutathione hydrolase